MAQSLRRLGSAAVAPVDVDVAVGQIAGPDGGFAAAEPDVDGDVAYDGV